MAVRIRKLARELDRTPRELIGVLHALGFQRYRSPEDMLSRQVIAKLRKGLVEGVRPLDVEVKAVKRESDVERLARSSDVMTRLVPGVVPVGVRTTPTPPPAARTVPASPPVAAAPRAVSAPAAPVPEMSSRARDAAVEVLESQRRALESERTMLAAERSELERDRARQEARQRSLDAEAESIRELRAALEAERTALGDAQKRVSAHIDTSDATTLQQLLEDRGLRGADEFERALIALASARLLRDVLWTVRLDPPDALEKVLKERVVLGEGDAHTIASKGAAWVTVAPARAEVPGGDELDRLLKQLGERWMLFGCRKIRIIGGSAHWHRVLRAMVDPRIELVQQVSGNRTELGARADVADADFIVLWGVDLAEDARAIYESGRPTVVEVPESSFRVLLQTVLDRLTD